MSHTLEYNAELVRRDDWGPDLATFHVRPDDPWASPGEAAFLPGQYVAIGLNSESEPALGSVRRSMSIASAPEEHAALQFYIRLVREPTSPLPLTPQLWDLAVGGRLFMTRRPVGKLTIPATVGTDDCRMLLMVAAGTGLAPFLSMMRSAVLRDAQADLRRCVILHGASYPRDLGYREELTGYAARNGLHYLPTISRPGEASGWRGATGRVEDFFCDGRIASLERQIGLDIGGLTPERAGVLVCGLEGTIRETLARLLVRRFVPEHRRVRATLGIPSGLAASIWWEQYDTSPIVDPKDTALVERLRG